MQHLYNIIIMRKLRLFANAVKYSDVAKNQVGANPTSLRFYCKAPEGYGQQMGGYEFKDEIEPFKKNTVVSERSSYLELIDSVKQSKVHLSFEWLRENCRCPSCYNEVTNQRNTLIFEIDKTIHPTSFSLDGDYLNVSWNDSHQSCYSLTWLRSHSRPEQWPARKLWEGDVSSKVAHIGATDVLSRQGLSELVQSIFEYGVGFVTDVKPDLQSTEEVILSVAAPLPTLFGAMWQFSNRQMDHEDTAYTNLALEAHSDTCYFIEPAGVIIFHCVARQCTGGETLLVDGFQAAAEVLKDAPELYQCLTTVDAHYHYLEKGCHLAASGPVIRHSSNDSICQIRYNLYDRSAQPVCGDAAKWYAALRCLAHTVRRPSAQWWLALRPGTVVFIDNWRVLHGRAAFNGPRTVCGAYLARADLLSRARLLGLIH